MRNKFLVLWLAGVVSTVLALPYIFELQRDVLATVPTPLPIIGLLAIAQTALLLAVTVFFGLKLSKRIHVPPLIFFETNIPLKKKIRDIIRLSVPIGIAVGFIIKFADTFFVTKIPELVAVVEQIPLWKILLVAPYGGVVEELLLRLFCVSLFAWLLGKITRSTEVAKSNAIMWAAIIVAAILFGLGHLPVTAAITPITPIVVARAILLNGIAGLVFGWLYWKKGLEYGIVAHFTTDIVLLAILPALLQ